MDQNLSQQLPARKTGGKGIYLSYRAILISFGVLFTLLFISIVFFIWIGNSQQQLLAQETVITPFVSPKPQKKEAPFELIGFLPAWIEPEEYNISGRNLSQVIYFGLGVDSAGNFIKSTEDNKQILDWTRFDSPEFKKFKKQAISSGTKVLIAVKNFDNESIDTLISNKNSVKNFTKQLIKLLDDYDLSGVNLDFEYITATTFPTRKYLNRFVEIVVSDVKGHNANWIVSIDVGAGAVMTDVAYDIPKLGTLVDQIIIMGYDFHLPRSQVAGHIAPLHTSGEAPSIVKSITSLAGRITYDKVVLGMPFYGYEWETVTDKLRSNTIENSGATATYKRVQELLKNRKDVKTHWDNRAAAPWLTYRQSGLIKQIYYEDARSLKKKVEYAKGKGILGAAVWALGYEGEYKDIWEAFK